MKRRAGMNELRKNKSELQRMNKVVEQFADDSSTVFKK
jgi:hypothetical protein